MSVRVDGEKLVIYKGKIGMADACCGCCCIDGEQDDTKATRQACQDAGGTWYSGVPCGDFPVCNECWTCLDLDGEGVVITATVKVTLPAPDGAGCDVAGPHEATFEIQKNGDWYDGEALVDVGDGRMIQLYAILECVEDATCEPGQMVWISNAAVQTNQIFGDVESCGLPCATSIVNGFTSSPGNFLYHETKLVDGDCRPQDGEKTLEIGCDGSTGSLEWSLEFAY